MASVCVAREMTVGHRHVRYSLNVGGSETLLEPIPYGSLYENLLWLSTKVTSDYLYFCSEDVILTQAQEQELIRHLEFQAPGQLHAIKLDVVGRLGGEPMVSHTPEDTRCSFDLKFSQLVFPIPQSKRIFQRLAASKYNHRCKLFGEQLLQAGLQKDGVTGPYPVDVVVTHVGMTRGMLASRRMRVRSLVGAVCIAFEERLHWQFLQNLAIKGYCFVRKIF